MLNRKRIVVIEPDDVWLNSVVHLINSSDKFVIVGNYTTWVEASSHLLRVKPDIVVAEIFVQGKSETASISATKEKLPNTEILVLTSQEED